MFPGFWGRSGDIRKEILNDFPMLKRKINGKRLIYLDNATTTQKPIQVLDTLYDFYSKLNFIPYQGSNVLCELATEAYEKCKNKFRKFINANYNEEIIFINDISDALNLIAFKWGFDIIDKNDNIILSVMEQCNNISPWLEIAKRKNANIYYIPITKEGLLDLTYLDKFKDVKLLIVTHVSNILGTINPIEELSKWVHGNGGFIIVDGSYSTPHMQIDIKRLNVDFFFFSGHKMLGPMGIGILYCKKDILENTDIVIPLDNIRDKKYPCISKRGIFNLGSIVALGMAVDYIISLGIKWIRNHEIRLTKYTIELLSKIQGINIFGPHDVNLRVGIISFLFNDLDPTYLAKYLCKYGIIIGDGMYGSEILCKYLGVNSINRISFYIYNWDDDINELYNILSKING